MDCRLSWGVAPLVVAQPIEKITKRNMHNPILKSFTFPVSLGLIELKFEQKFIIDISLQTFYRQLWDNSLIRLIFYRELKK
jgi:hypothetical protein